MSKSILSEQISVALNGASMALIDIHAGDGNLTMGRLPNGEQVLVSGRLEYVEGQDLPDRHVEVKDGKAYLTVRGSRDMRPRFRLLWAKHNGATTSLIYLNPTILADVTAGSNGGNLNLDFSGCRISRLSTDTGGGNIDIVLPDKTAELVVDAKTGAGNVSVSIPCGVATRIHASTGLGNVIIDPSFHQMDHTTYQSPDFEQAASKVDLNAASGVGDIIIRVK